MILERESLMTKLEDFERTASDPNRFFVRGKLFVFCPLEGTLIFKQDFQTLNLPRL